jgi:hypothetical protein
MSNRKEYHRQWNEKNKERIKEQKKAYYQNTKKERTDADLKYKYGISLEEYDRMREEQGYKCYCCGITEEALTEKYPDSHHKKLCVDHCHTTGRVRKLICSACNTLIGYLEKREDKLEAALRYIDEHKR